MVRYSTPLKLTQRQFRFLQLMYPTGSVCIGLDVGEHMLDRGYLILGKNERYTLSPAGIKVVEAILKRRSALPKPTVVATSADEATS